MKRASAEKVSAALTLLTAPASIKSIGREKLVVVAKSQMEELVRHRLETPLRAILLGMVLHKLKATCKHGEWMPLYEQILPAVKFCSSSTSRRLVSQYMRLAGEFLGATGTATPEFLALPGGQVELSLETSDATAKRFMAKMADFVGDRSLEELLGDLGLKDSQASRLRNLSKDEAEEPAEDAPAPTLQESFNTIEEHLRIALAGALDRATWMSFSRQQHEDLRHIFEEAAGELRERFLKTHPQRKEDSK
jgi:signal transduction histidine kinase